MVLKEFRPLLLCVNLQLARYVWTTVLVRCAFEDLPVISVGYSCHHLALLSSCMQRSSSFWASRLHVIPQLGQILPNDIVVPNKMDNDLWRICDWNMINESMSINKIFHDLMINILVTGSMSWRSCMGLPVSTCYTLLYSTPARWGQVLPPNKFPEEQNMKLVLVVAGVPEWRSKGEWRILNKEILLMEDILHHPGCIKPCKSWENLPINWCTISSINSSVVLGLAAMHSHAMPFMSLD